MNNQSTNRLTIVTAQLNLLVGDIEGNTKKIIKIANQAYKKNHADLILFPELAITSYPPEDLLLRPALYQRVHHALKLITKEVTQGTLIVGHPEFKTGKYYNSASVIQDGKIIANYAKQDLPNYRVFDEKRYFTPGDQPCILTLKGVQIGILICEDLWGEASIKRSLSAGAELIVSIHASPFAQDKSHHRRDLLIKNTNQYKIPIVYLNLVGGQDELVFDGGSMVYNQYSEMVQSSPYWKEDIMAITFDVDNKLNVLTRQPMPAEPSDEEKIYNALLLGIRDYINKNNFPGAIIGASGGIDSALTLCLAVDALGPDRVKAIFMPSEFTSKDSVNDVKTQIACLKINLETMSIDSIFQIFLKKLAPLLKNTQPDVTEENLQSRIRGTTLMAISNKTNWLVLSTGNKSEMAVGYSTLYGDMVGGFAAIKDVYKTMVYRLCRYRNTLSPMIPEHILEKAPSAELAAGQTDQDTLPPYDILDAILERYIAKDQDPSSITATGFDPKLVNKIVAMVNRNEYKRHQAPVGIRITERAFGKDRRYPITSRFSKPDAY